MVITVKLVGYSVNVFNRSGIFFMVLLVLSFKPILPWHVVVRKTSTGGILPLDGRDINLKNIYEILLKYQWPSNLAWLPKLSKQEKSVLFANRLFASREGAETILIRQKLQNLSPFLFKYDAIFIPDLFYDLFQYISMFANGMPYDLNRLWRDAYWGSGYEKKDENIDARFISFLDGTIRDNAFLKFCRRKNKTILREISYIKFNNYLISNKYLTSIEELYERRYEILLSLVREFKAIIGGHLWAWRSRLRMHLDSLFIDREIKSLEEGAIEQSTFAKVLDLEYKSYMYNNVLVYRGGRLEDDKLHAIKPRYSISYGSSLLAAWISDPSACPFEYSQYHTGYALCPHPDKSPIYALRIDKQEYVENGMISTIFYQPPFALPAMGGISGEFFHPRMKASGGEKLLEESSIGGIASTSDFEFDKTGTIVVERDSKDHGEMIASYITDNSLVVYEPLNTEDEESDFEW